MINVNDLESEAIYKWDGTALVKLDINKDVVKLPVTREADEAVKELRKRVAAVMPTRPDISIVTSAILIHALQLDGMVDIVKSYGAKVYQS